MIDPGQLPDELAALFDAERAAPTADASTRSAVRARLTAVVALLPAKVAAATSAATVLGGTGKVIAAFAIALGGAGTVAVLESDDEAPRVAPAVAVERVADDSDSTATPYAVPQPEHVRRELVVPASPPVAPQRATPRQAAPTVARSEAKLLKRAWTALSAGDANHALELTREAETLSGASLVEERRALQIQALAKLGLAIDARSAAEKFIVEFPESVHRTQVERVVATVESP